jgi:hypothetical protein
MLLLFLCPGTSQVPSCWLSCQTSCCAPLHVAWQHRPASPPPLPRPLRCFVMWTLLLHHHGRVMGRDRLHQPPQGLQGSGYHTWQSRRHGQLPGKCPGGPAATKRVSISDPLVSSPVFTAAVPAPSAVTTSEIGPLISPPAGRRWSSGSALWRPATPLVDGQTSWPCILAPLYTVY